MSHLTKILKENEDLVNIFRKHWLVFLKPGCLALILLCLPFFLIFLLFSWNVIGLIIFIMLCLIGFYYFLKLLVEWRYNLILISTKRVIIFKQNGIFDQEVFETDFKTIADVSYRVKGLLETLFKFGSVRIKLINSEQAFLVEKIHKPREIQQLILSRVKMSE